MADIIIDGRIIRNNGFPVTDNTKLKIYGMHIKGIRVYR